MDDQQVFRMQTLELKAQFSIQFAQAGANFSFKILQVNKILMQM